MNMEEDISNPKELLQLQQKYKSCGSYVVEFYQQDPLNATPTQPVLFQRSASLAEKTISTYKQTASTIPPPPPPPALDIHTAVPTMFFPETDKQHHFNPESNYVSRFPLGFCGCYACGQEDHFRSKNFPLKQNGQFNKREFSENCRRISQNIRCLR